MQDFGSHWIQQAKDLPVSRFYSGPFIAAVTISRYANLYFLCVSVWLWNIHIFFVYTFRSHYPCSIFCLEEVPKTSRDYPWECWQVLHYSTLAEILLGIWLVAREPQWWEVPMTWVLHYLLGVAPSQDASGKWRFRLGFPTRKYHNPGGHCYWEEAIPKLSSFHVLVEFECWWKKSCTTVWMYKTLQIMG